MSIDLAPHHQQLVDDGYTIVENAIEPELFRSPLVAYFVKFKMNWLIKNR